MANNGTTTNGEVAKIATALKAAGQYDGTTDANELAVAEALRVSETMPARVIREAPSDRDPARDVQGAPPNLGRFVLPHVATLQGLATSLSKTYRASDEALKHSWDNARMMRNDVGIMECIEARQRATALLDWHLEPEDAKNQNEMDLVTKLEKILRKTPNFLKYRECLLHATWFGNYGNQHRYAWRQIGGVMRVTVNRWLPIHGDKLVWKIEENPGEEFERAGIRVGPGYSVGQMVNNGRSKVEMTERGMAYFLEPWERKLIAIHKHQIEDGAYEAPWDAGKIHGVGIRSKIYWEWYQKQELLAFLMEYLERAAFGIELWFYPSGNSTAKTDTENAAKQRLGNGRTIVLVPKPLGEDGDAYGVQHIEPGLGGIDALKDILDKYFGHRMKRYILGQTLSSEADATGMGSGLAELQQATLLDIIKYDATNLEETITADLVNPIKDWNFPSAKGIEIRFVIDTESDDSKEKLEAAKLAHEMGARISEKAVLEMVGLALPTADDRILPGPSDQGGGGGAGPAVPNPFGQEQGAEGEPAAEGDGDQDPALTFTGERKSPDELDAA